jgi:hypothetical protein
VPTRSPVQWVQGFKWPEREADHSLPFSIKINNAWSILCPLFDASVTSFEAKAHINLIQKSSSNPKENAMLLHYNDQLLMLFKEIITV